MARPEGRNHHLVRLEERNLCVEEKAPKPLTPRLASLERTNASLRRAGQLAPLKQGPPADESIPPLGQTAGVRPWETEHFSDSHEKARSHIFCMIRFKHKQWFMSWEGSCLESSQGRAGTSRLTYLRVPEARADRVQREENGEATTRNPMP